MKKSETVIAMGVVFHDINAIKVEMTDSFESLMNKFYSIMRKHGICQGTKSDNGVCVSNPEWIMCFETFKMHKILAFDLFLILNEPPVDLIAYDL